MADITPITVGLFGFLKEQEDKVKSYFANADKWSPPWEFILAVENANVVIVDIPSDNDHKEIDKLKLEFPNAELVAFSSKKPQQAKWHLVRQPNGKFSIVGLSHLVLRLSPVIQRNLAEGYEPKTAAYTAIAKPNETAETGLSTIPDEEDIEQEPGDMLTFFNQLDSILDSNPNEKRKRFNE